MNKAIVIAFIINTVGINSYTQQLSHQVLVPVAGIASGNSISYSQTIGETAVEILGCSDFVFTQGFQQPAMKLSVADAPPGTGVKVYPNPATDNITVELFGEEARTYRIEVLDITGTVVFSTRRIYDRQYWHKVPVDIVNLVRGFYLVRIISEDKLVNRSFKIEKV